MHSNIYSIGVHCILLRGEDRFLYRVEKLIKIFLKSYECFSFPLKIVPDDNNGVISVWPKPVFFIIIKG